MKLYVARHHFAGDYRHDDPRAERLRSLTAAGRMQARAVGNALRGKGVRPTVVLASPLARTIQTADIYGEILRAPVEPSDSLVPHMPVSRFLQKLGERGMRRVLVVGHHDNLSPAIAELLDGETAPDDDLLMGEARGYDLDRSAGTLDEVFRITPKDLGLADLGAR